MKQDTDLKKQLEKSIKLAHLELPEKEKKALLGELEKILHFVSIIEKTDKNSKNSFTPEEKEFPQIKKTNAMRTDKSSDFTNKAGLKKEIPSIQNNLIKVKKI